MNDDWQRIETCPENTYVHLFGYKLVSLGLMRRVEGEAKFKALLSPKHYTGTQMWANIDCPTSWMPLSRPEPPAKPEVRVERFKIFPDPPSRRFDLRLCWASDLDWSGPFVHVFSSNREYLEALGKWATGKPLEEVQEALKSTEVHDV